MASDDIPNFGSEEFSVSTEKPQTRSGAFIVLALAVVAGGGFMFYKHGPSSAAAAPAVAEGPSEAQKSIAEFLQVGGKDITEIEQGLRNTEQVVKQFNAYPSMTQVPLSDLKSNPFRADAVRQPEIAAAPVGPTSEDERRKLLAERRIKSMEAASKLRLESIMTGRAGPGATAMINGEVVKAGDKVGGFVIESIKPGVVVVREGNFRFERRLGQ